MILELRELFVPLGRYRGVFLSFQSRCELTTSLGLLVSRSLLLEKIAPEAFPSTPHSVVSQVVSLASKLRSDVGSIATLDDSIDETEQCVVDTTRELDNLNRVLYMQARKLRSKNGKDDGTSAIRDESWNTLYSKHQLLITELRSKHELQSRRSCLVNLLLSEARSIPKDDQSPDLTATSLDAVLKETDEALSQAQSELVPAFERTNWILTRLADAVEKEQELSEAIMPKLNQQRRVCAALLSCKIASLQMETPVVDERETQQALATATAQMKKLDGVQDLLTKLSSCHGFVKGLQTKLESEEVGLYVLCPDIHNIHLL